MQGEIDGGRTGIRGQKLVGGRLDQRGEAFLELVDLRPLADVAATEGSGQKRGCVLGDEHLEEWDHPDTSL